MIPRMRTQKECLKLLRQDDPDTALTQTALRTKVLTGEIPHVKVGAKRLVNYDALLLYLQSPEQSKEYVTADYGKIRRLG